MLMQLHLCASYACPTIYTGRSSLKKLDRDIAIICKINLNCCIAIAANYAPFMHGFTIALLFVEIFGKDYLRACSFKCCVLTLNACC